MIFKLTVLCAVLGATVAHDLIQNPHVPQPYSFGYTVRDKHGEQYRHESGIGGHAVKGSYGLTDDRGVYRRVNYVADKGGFRAVVMSNEPGTANQDPAAVKVISSAHPYYEPREVYGGHRLNYGPGHASVGYSVQDGLLGPAIKGQAGHRLGVNSVNPGYISSIDHGFGGHKSGLGLSPGPGYAQHGVGSGYSGPGYAQHGVGSGYSGPGYAQHGVGSGYSGPGYALHRVGSGYAQHGVGSGYSGPGYAQIGVGSGYPGPGYAQNGLGSGYSGPGTSLENGGLVYARPKAQLEYSGHGKRLDGIHRPGAGYLNSGRYGSIYGYGY